MTPADLLLGFLGRGPASRMALIGALLGRGYPYDQAEIEANQAIFSLTKCGRIESFNGDCFRLTASAAKMEAGRAETERITK